MNYLKFNFWMNYFTETNCWTFLRACIELCNHVSTLHSIWTEKYYIQFTTYLPTYLPYLHLTLYYIIFDFKVQKKGHKKAKIDISLLYSIPFVCCVNAPRKIYFPILLSIFYRPIADTLSICHAAVWVHVYMYRDFCFLLKTHWEFYWSLDEDMYDAAEVRIDGNWKWNIQTRIWIWWNIFYELAVQ